MSDSSLSDVSPSDATLERALRQAVQHIYQTGNSEDLTVRRVRTAAETGLAIDPGFFKQASWKERSKRIIEKEAEAQASSSHNGDISSPPTKPVASPADRSPKVATRRKPQESAQLSSEGNPKLKKRRTRKIESASDDDLSDIKAAATSGQHDEKLAEQESSPSQREERSKSIQSEFSSGEPCKAPVEPEQDPKRDLVTEKSESELSSLIDEEPKKKPKRRLSESKDSKSKKKNTQMPKSKKMTETKTDPDSEEIKRLQGWLVKCGIRKMWFRELASCDTSKAKIHHLKDMLTEAGMTGRYSVEKANRIRNERELKSELEAVQAGDKHWGKENSVGEDDVKPKRRLARGLKELDFLNDDDGEETD